MIRSFFTSALMLLALCASAQADIKFAIGEPAEDSTRSGIGQISGWAVSDRQIVSVEAFIDGVSVGLVPYGGTRLDVAEAFPGYPDSEMSGWSMKWNYSLLSQGDHELTVVVTDIDGNQLSKSVSFATTGFTSEFIKDPEAVDISNAVVSTPEPGKILIRGAVVEGENVDIELCWDTATQQFQIERILRESAEKENQSPQANAGSSFDVEMAESVVINGMASDPDGSIVSWSWKQVAGNKVQLTDADQPTVKFTAPDTAGAIRLRLTVVDDGGASDSDDVVIEVIDSPSEPEPENLAPSADAGSDRTVEPGEVISVQGYASDTDGTIASWNWEVIAGAQVGLNNAHTDRVTFTALNEEG
ncbi:MAG: Ig-like domain-containing protein, partial [Xanthomonadales bacterium]|nr:Ig-like domain-containing protein [Xanthomonadales bacterium]